MNENPQKARQFDRFHIDLARGSLRAGDQDIALRPKTYEVLCYLANNAGRLVAKRELDDAVWPNVAVTEASLIQCIRELREKLGDDERRLIKTVHRRGYMLDAVVSDVELPRPQPATAMEQLKAPADDQAEVPATGETAENLATLVQPSPAVPRRSRTIWAASLATLLIAVILGGLHEFAGRSATPQRAQANTPPSSAQPLSGFRDCEECPDMVVLPTGEFDMGLMDVGGKRGPLKRVTIAKAIAVGRYEVTVDQFASFVEKAHFPVSPKCNVVMGSEQTLNPRFEQDADFREQPGIRVTGKHPASCISWHDAKAYVAWLRRRTGKPYRLLSEAEWEYAARAGTSGAFSFAGGAVQSCEYARFADLDSPFPYKTGCHSNNPVRGPLPVGSLKPNPWGLYDMHGNVWEWADDCWSVDAALGPADGSPLEQAVNCEIGVVRGGSWITTLRRLNVGFRLDQPTNWRHHSIGFRVAMTLDK